MRGVLLLLLVLLLATLAAACREETAPEPSPTPSPAVTAEATTPPAPTPTSPPAETPTPSEAETPLAGVACAAGSTDEFVEAQAEASFTLYCPTFLPEGLALQELRFSPLGATPAMDAPPPGELNAAFASSDLETQVVLYQGRLGASFVASIVELAEDEGVSPEPVAYGDLGGILYSPLTTISSVALGAFVIVDFPGGITHVLHTAEVDVATVREIAAAMQPVSP